MFNFYGFRVFGSVRECGRVECRECGRKFERGRFYLFSCGEVSICIGWYCWCNSWFEVNLYFGKEGSLRLVGLIIWILVELDISVFYVVGCNFLFIFF